MNFHDSLEQKVATHIEATVIRKSKIISMGVAYDHIKHIVDVLHPTSEERTYYHHKGCNRIKAVPVQSMYVINGGQLLSLGGCTNERIVDFVEGGLRTNILDVDMNLIQSDIGKVRLRPIPDTTHTTVGIIESAVRERLESDTDVILYPHRSPHYLTMLDTSKLTTREMDEMETIITERLTPLIDEILEWCESGEYGLDSVVGVTAIGVNFKLERLGTIYEFQQADRISREHSSRSYSY